MTVTSPQINEAPSAVKRELERLEFDERVPALQRQAAEYEMMEGVRSLLPIDDMGRSVGDPEFYATRIALPVVYAPNARTYKLNERGAKILKFPHHHAVAAYGYELADKNAKRFKAMCEGVDLRTARRKLRDASKNFDRRANFRNAKVEWTDGGRGVGLASILEARAEAVLWHKIVRNLETFAEIRRHNKRNKTLAADLAAGIVRRRVRRTDGVWSA